jgi:hypothetical protein
MKPKLAEVRAWCPKSKFGLWEEYISEFKPQVVRKLKDEGIDIKATKVRIVPVIVKEIKKK